MLFTTFTAATAQSIQATENLVDSLQQQLEVARQQLAQLQQQQQAEQTAKSAAQTALEMAAKARKLVAIAYGQEAVEEFNRALLSDLQPVSELPGAVDDAATNSSPEPTPTGGGAVVTTVVVEETIEVTASEVITPTEPKEVVSESSKEPDFSRLNWQQLQKLAAASNISPRGKKRPEIQSLLIQQGVTQFDIDSAA